MLRALLLGLAAAALPMLSAAAAPATPAEAARLSTVFERYVGAAAPGEPPRATVTPQGDSYAVTVDLKRALAGLDALGLDLDPYTVSMTLTPLPDGTWRVRSDGSAPLTVRFGGATFGSVAKTGTFDGIFDPKLESFSSFEQDQTGVGTTRVSPTGAQSFADDTVKAVGTGLPADGGTVTTTATATATGASADFTFKPAAPPPSSTNPAVPPPPQAGTTLGYRAPSTRGAFHADRLDAPKALDLWAFLAAHPSRDSVVAAQDDLKTLLRAGLPYLAGIGQDVSLASPSLATPIGTVTARSAGFGVEASGLGGIGHAAITLSAADLAVPAGQLPPWSSGLVPTALDLHVGLDGFHAAEAARALVDDVDLRKEVIVTPEQKEQVGHLFWPGDGTVTLRPSRVVTRALDLAMEGHATFGAQAAGQVTITARGLDKEIAALQAQAATDPGAGQVLGPLVLAKNLAKPNPDGSLAWVIAFGNGPVTVNGAALQ